SAWRALRATLRSGPTATRRLPANADTRVESEWEVCIGARPGWWTARLLFAPGNIQDSARIGRQPVVDRGRGDRRMAHGDGDLVERADHVADGVEAVDAGLQVGIGVQRALVVHGRAEPTRKSRLRIAAQDRVQGVVFARTAVLERDRAGRGIAAQPARRVGI